jgi:hypothetical protein
VCTDSACAACSDDSSCQSAYGGDYSCVQGDCVVPPPPGCTSDNDCAQDEICNVGTGDCGPAANVCASHSVGQACGGGNLCCTRHGDLTCVDVDCCTAADCPTNNTCESGACVPPASGCGQPADGVYYVDPSFNGAISNGTQSCPWKTLHGGYSAVKNDDFDGLTHVYVKGTITATSEGGADKFPLSVPVHSVTQPWPNGANPVIVAPAGVTALQVLYTAGAAFDQTFTAKLSNLEIKQASGGGTAGAGIHVVGGSDDKPIHIDHVDIHGCYNGIHVTDGGRTELGWGVNAHDNIGTGLYVDVGQNPTLIPSPNG